MVNGERVQILSELEQRCLIPAANGYETKCVVWCPSTRREEIRYVRHINPSDSTCIPDASKLIFRPRDMLDY